MSHAPQTETRFLDRDMTEVELHAVAAGRAAVYSARCPGKTTPNEDAAALIRLDDASGILVVADGLGGSQAGDRAARLATESMKRSIDRVVAEELMLRTAILNGFEQANQAVLELAVGAATTLAVVEIAAGVVRPYHAGDSMILVVGQRGKIKLQTTSHSPVGFAVEAGLLDEKEAMHHEERHLVSNVIGSSEMKIEIGPSIDLAPRDTLLVASDGLFDNVHVSETIEYIRKGKLIDAARRLVTCSQRRMAGSDEAQPSKPDDITFILFRLSAAAA